MDGAREFGDFEDETGDSLGFQLRARLSPRRAHLRAAATAATPPPPPPRAPENRPPTVKARCEPCTVEVGRTSTVTATPAIPTAIR